MKRRALQRNLKRLRNQGTGRAEFREGVRNIGYILGREIFQEMPTIKRNITASFSGPHFIDELVHEPALIYVERAGRELYFGLQNAFPGAESGVIGASRDEETLESTISYAALPNMKGKEAIVADTMIATAGSMIQALDLVKQYEPKKIHVLGVLASRYAIEKLHDYDRNLEIHVAAIDPELDDRGYIVPGLGDAGDRCYGEKK